MGGTMMFFSNAKAIANLILSGLLERHPRLKVVSVESGIGWIPFLLEALEYGLRENGTEGRSGLSLTPIEYFQRQVYACFWFEQRDISHAIRLLGIDNCMFESDFPHPTCLYPDPLLQSQEGLALLSEDERRKVLSLNAAKVYNLDI